LTLNISEDKSPQGTEAQHDALVFHTNILAEQGELRTPSAPFTPSCYIQKQTQHGVERSLMEEQASAQNEEREREEKLLN